MAKFTFTGPGGQTIEVTGPDGATPEQAWQIAQQHAEPPADTRTQRVKEFMGKTLERAEEFSPLAPVARGVLKAGAGLLQTGADVAGAVGAIPPAVGNRLTDFVNAIMPEAKTPKEKAGEFIGEAAPFVAAAPESVAGMAAVGGLAGATQFQPQRSQGDRLVERGAAGIGGAATAGALGAAGDFATKVMNSKEVGKLVSKVQQAYNENDPAIAAQRGTLNQLVDRLQNRYSGLGQQTVAAGDRLGPINMSDTEQKLRDIADSTGKMLAPDKKGVSILDNAVDVLAPERKLPDKITVMGQDFFRDPTGQYLTKNKVQALPQRIVDAALKDRGINPAPDIRFSHMQQSIEEMNQYLKDAKNPNNPATKAVRDARDLLQKKLDAFKTPEVKKLEKKATTFYEKNLAKYDDPTIKDILDTQDPLDRANKAIKVALGDDAKAGQTVADLVGPKGQEAVRQGVISRALASSADKKGEIDATKFVNFFDKKGGFDAFQNADSKLTIDGIKNLLKEDALARGESSAPSIGHPSGQWGWFLGFTRLMEGDIKGAGAATAGAMLVRPTVEFFNRAMKDRFGRNLLAASAKAVPGTPRAGRILQQLVTRFAPATAGTAAGQVAGQQ